MAVRGQVIGRAQVDGRWRLLIGAYRQLHAVTSTSCHIFRPDELLLMALDKVTDVSIVHGMRSLRQVYLETVELEACEFWLGCSRSLSIRRAWSTPSGRLSCG